MSTACLYFDANNWIPFPDYEKVAKEIMDAVEQDRRAVELVDAHGSRHVIIIGNITDVSEGELE